MRLARDSVSAGSREHSSEPTAVLPPFREREREAPGFDIRNYSVSRSFESLGKLLIAREVIVADHRGPGSRQLFGRGIHGGPRVK